MGGLLKYLSENKQLELAKRVLQIAYEKSRFYRNKYSQIKPKKIDNFDEWRKLPLLSRDELYENSYPRSMDMLTDELKRAIVLSTGGSTGVARYSVYSHEDYDTIVDVQARALILQGVNERDIVANLFVAGYLWPSFLGAHNIIRKMGAVELPIAAIPDMDKIVYFLRKFKPTVLLCVPSMLVYIADKIIQEKKPIESVRLIQFGGEPLAESARSHIKKAFTNAEIKAAAYSSSDCGIMGYQCEYCDQDEYHIPTELQLIEIIDTELNRACQKNETGEIIVTTLKRFLMPLIRYRVGDIGYIKDKPCKCGDKNPVLVLKGRAGDDFKLGGGFITMREIDEAIKDFVSKDGISANYQLELDENDKGKVGFILRIESTDIEKSTKQAEAIKSSLAEKIYMIGLAVKAKYFHTYRVEFVPAGSLPRSPITGKVKRLLDKRIKA